MSSLNRLSMTMLSDRASSTHRASVDPVTGLPDGRALTDRLEFHIARCRQKPTSRILALLYVDLDRFHCVNRYFGRSAGDALLAETARRLAEHSPAGTELYRYSADEFYLIIPNLEQVSGLYAVAQRLLDAITGAFTRDGKDMLISASMGASLYPNDGTRTDDLMCSADLAMRRAKEKGGGFQMFYPDMEKEMHLSLDIESGLRRALKEGQLSLVYQPLIHLESGRLTGLEALVRWNHPEWGETLPSRFISIAEETGLIVPTGQWVLEEACRQYAEWKSLGFTDCGLSVNVSVAQVMHQGFIQHVEDTIKKSGMDPTRLQLELTESIALGNSAYIFEVMKRLKRLGVRIAVDDFGTGYSSLSSLKRIPVHTLKLDRSLIKDADQDENSGAIILTLITLARKIGVRTLAEGVERPGQHHFLKQLGCDEAQGFLYSPPVQADSILPIMRESRSFGLRA